MQQPIAVILEGALGGSALFDSVPIAPAMTSPQRALVDRVARSLLSDLTNVLASQIGIRLEGEPQTKLKNESDGMLVNCEFSNLSVPAMVSIAVSAELLARAAEKGAAKGDEPNPEMLAALSKWSWSLEAELGRIEMSLRRVMDLSVGDVIRLDTAGRGFRERAHRSIPKFEAVPVTTRGQMAVEIRSRHAR